MTKRKPAKRATKKTKKTKVKAQETVKIYVPTDTGFKQVLPESEDSITTKPDLARVTVPLAYAIDAPAPQSSRLLTFTSIASMMCGGASLVAGFYADTPLWFSLLTVAGLAALVVGFIVWERQ